MCDGRFRHAEKDVLKMLKNNLAGKKWVGNF
jgi:hypothetical protein